MRSYLKEQVDKIMAYLLKVERRTLLWENPNMTGEMGATTITLSDDLSNYDAIEIDYNAFVNVHRTSQRCYNISQDITLSNGDSNSLYRTISKASERTLSIGIGYLGANASNQACIPRRIYGIKLGGYYVAQLFQGFAPFSRLGVA